MLISKTVHIKQTQWANLQFVNLTISTHIKQTQWDYLISNNINIKQTQIWPTKKYNMGLDQPIYSKLLCAFSHIIIYSSLNLDPKSRVWSQYKNAIIQFSFNFQSSSENKNYSSLFRLGISSKKTSEYRNYTEMETAFPVRHTSFSSDIKASSASAFRLM